MLRDPQKIDIAPKQVTVEKIEQKVVMVENARKRSALVHLLTNTSVTKAIVFARTKHGADKIAKQLRKSDIEAEAIHGNKSQNARVRSLEAFQSGKCWVLVATDVASRGIDIDAVSHVINYELPHEPESYVHRIGRTGRAGADGIAWSLVDPDERKRLKAIERLVKRKIPVEDLEFEELPQTSEAPRSAQQPRGNARSGNGKSQQGKAQHNKPRKKQQQQRGKPRNQRNPYQPLAPHDDSVAREQELQAQGNVAHPAGSSKGSQSGDAEAKPEGSKRRPRRRRAKARVG